MLQKTIYDIKNIKIQGAENIAKAAIKAISDALYKSENTKNTSGTLFDELIFAKKLLENSRPTEPCLRNTLIFLFFGVTESNVSQKLRQNILLAQEHFSVSGKDITAIGARKIADGMTVFTHCHSGTVMDILKEAKSQGKNFSVKNTETRPLFQGRKTALELSGAGIPVEHFVDSGAKIAIKRSDIMLIGADAITAEGRIINKIGSEMFAEIAHKHDIPVYVCTNSWKFDSDTVFGYDETIEKRIEEEVWEDKPKKVKISNYAFEIINPVLVTGIISEIGVYKPEIFVGEVERYYPWLFTKKKKRILQLKNL